MKRMKYVVMLVVVLALGLMVASVSASAYTTSFTTSIVYQNVGSGSADINFAFYPEGNGTAAVNIPVTLAQNAGSSLYVGNVNGVADGFNGSVIMSANEPVTAVMVQISSDPTVVNRPLANGFSQGSDTVRLATVLKNTFGQTSRFSIQNAHTGAVDLDITLYDSAGVATLVEYNNLPAGAAKYYDMGTMSEIAASSYNGSAVIEAFEAGTTNPAPVVAAVMELNTSNGNVSSFEGTAGGGDTVYVPSALCNAFGGQNTAYAVQNTGNAPVDVTVTYSNGNTDGVNGLAVGAKKSFIGCDVNPANYSGAATITAPGGEVVVVFKVYGLALSTAALGSPTGSDTLSIPYARWTESQWGVGGRQRAYVAIQNVGSALNSGDVVVRYINKDGQEVGTHTLGAMATGAKLNTNAGAATPAAGFAQSDLDEFGYIGGFGGAIIVEGPSGSSLVAVDRISSLASYGQVGEDAVGIAIGN
jgi:hypothetical protein